MRKKNKIQLDEMTYEDIMLYRVKFIENCSTQIESNKQYTNELYFYIKVRFKHLEEERFRRWEDEVKNKQGDALDLKGKKSIISLGFDFNYLLGVAHDLKEIEEFQFIKGVKHNLDEKLVAETQKLWS